jgi:hypothetical protein
MKVAPSIIFTLILSVIAALFVFTALGFPLRVRLYPLTIGSVLLILCVVLLVSDIRRTMAGKSLEKGTGLPADLQMDYGLPAQVVGKKFFINFALIGALYAGIWLFGLKIAITAFFIMYLTFQGRTRWFVTLGYTAAAILFIVYLDLVIHAFWPEGILKQWLPWLP